MQKRSTGKPLAMCEMKTAVVTLDAGKEDEEIRSKYGLAALRQARLARVVHEAWDQGVSLTQEDIAAKLLNCGVRTVRRDIKALAKRGVIVPTRGAAKRHRSSITQGRSRQAFHGVCNSKFLSKWVT